MLKRLFGEHGAKDIITVFHKPSLPASTRVVTFLQRHQANVQSKTTEDQASDVDVSPPTARADFDLDVQENEPTSDQLKSILEYVGTGKAGTVVSGARDLSDAMEKVKKDASLFQRPLVVDWHLGKVAVGDNESEILKMLKNVPKAE